MNRAAGSWRRGRPWGTVVGDVPVEGAPTGADAIEYYGGHLIAESVADVNLPLIEAAPELLKALRDITPDMPAADALCHRGLLPQEECRQCQKVARARAVIAKAERHDSHE